MQVKNRIFTFWEPKENIPEYIKLCMSTWGKFLPDYEIVVLDYSNLHDWLDKKTYNSILCKGFSLPKQADAIRCAILKQYGGLWLDADTIILSNKIDELLKEDSDFILIGRHIAFIYAKSTSKILTLWEKEVKTRVMHYKRLKYFFKIFNHKYYKAMKKWDYLGNGIINKYIDNADKKDFHSFNVEEVSAFPEVNYYKPKVGEDFVNAYVNFWFNNDFADYVLNNESSKIICLHNSWTPKEFKQLSSNEFLEQNCTLSNLLRKIL